MIAPRYRTAGIRFPTLDVATGQRGRNRHRRVSESVPGIRVCAIGRCVGNAWGRGPSLYACRDLTTSRLEQMVKFQLLDEPPDSESGISGWAAAPELRDMRELLRKNPGKWVALPNIDDAPDKAYLNRATHIKSSANRARRNNVGHSAWRGMNAVIRGGVVYVTYSDTPE